MTCEVCGNQSRVTLWKKNQTNNAEIVKKQENVNNSQKREKPNKNKNKTLLLSNTSKNSAKKGAPSTSAMKKNSLLQLAAALRTKTKLSDTNRRLKQMFNSK